MINEMTDTAQLPFNEAIDFFKQKIKLPSASWTDIWQEQHSLAFVVAGAQTDALVSDFYNALIAAKEKGTGYAAFKEEFDAIVSRHKWAHNGTPGWRSQVIYDTNMQSAYNAGRWQQQWALRHEMPYLVYRHTSIEHPRLWHKAWDGTILPITSPWWNTHYAANGWGCKCRVDPLTQTQAEQAWTAAGKTGPDPEPVVEWEDVVVGKNGNNPRTVRTPQGIDPGFAYNSGKAYLEPHTVPPLTGYDTVLAERGTPWPTGVVRPALPSPTRVPPSVRMPADSSPVEAVTQFLDIFDATLDQGVVFIDAAETAVVVSKALFFSGKNKEADNFKWLSAPDKAKRLENINLLAMTLAQPDEIWWAWEEDREWTKNHPDEPKKWELKRRYLRAFDVTGETVSEYGVVAFEWGAKGWSGSTAFTPDRPTEAARAGYFDRQRVGRLVFKRP